MTNHLIPNLLLETMEKAFKLTFNGVLQWRGLVFDEVSSWKFQQK